MGVHFETTTYFMRCTSKKVKNKDQYGAVMKRAKSKYVYFVSYESISTGAVGSAIYKSTKKITSGKDVKDIMIKLIVDNEIMLTSVSDIRITNISFLHEVYLQNTRYYVAKNRNY